MAELPLETFCSGMMTFDNSIVGIISFLAAYTVPRIDSPE